MSSLRILATTVLVLGAACSAPTAAPRPQVARPYRFVGNHAVPSAALAAAIAGRPENDALALRVLLVYLDRGYRDAQVQRPTRAADGALVFEITEGRRYRVGAIDLALHHEADASDPLDEIHRLRRRLRLAPGDWWSRTRLDASTHALRAHYQDAGYAFADVRVTDRPHSGEPIVDLRFEIDRGPIARFGTISIAGQVTVPEEVIRGEIRVRTGELFSLSKLERTRAALIATGLFQHVVISTTRQPDDPPTVMVLIEVEE